MDLLAELMGRQERLGESDAQFALRLGVSRSQWSKTKARKRRMADRVLAGVIRSFPDLEPVAWQYKRQSLGLPSTQVAVGGSTRS